MEVLEKSGPPLCYQWQMRYTFGQILDDFFALFLKNVETSYSGRLRAPAVHGVSSLLPSDEASMFHKVHKHAESHLRNPRVTLIFAFD